MRYVLYIGAIVLAFMASLLWLLERQVQQDFTRLQQLRNADPKAYLQELKIAGDRRWEAELRNLDPEEYERFVAERRRNEEAVRQAEISKLLDELKTVPSTDLNKTIAIYSRLSTLDPQNAEYQSKGQEAVRNAKIGKLLDELKTEKDKNIIHTIYMNLTTLDPENEEYKKGRQAVAHQVAQAGCASASGLPSLAVDEECRLKLLAGIIKAKGYNCPNIGRAQSRGQNVYGRVMRVYCTSGRLDVIERPDGGYLVTPVIDLD